MKKIIRTFKIALFLFLSFAIQAKGNGADDPIKSIHISTSANSWVVDDVEKTAEVITKKGIQNWKSSTTKIRTYFKVSATGKIHLALKGNTIKGSSVIKVGFNNKSKEITLTNTKEGLISIDTYTIYKPGYYFVELQGVTKESDFFAVIPEIVIGGEATSKKVYYVNEDVYWGRRGPSVHLMYQQPTEVKNAVWFYNEMTIPKGNDVLHSYFMANGFAEGYFGIQVNSKTERRILFSVWSAYSTDDPNLIPEEYNVTKVAAGKDVLVQNFGNEGSGKQSIKKYNWKAGITYKFLTKVVPVSENATEYSGYFYDPELGQWQLIATLRRPKTVTYLKRPHSFLENFSPSMGNVSRKVLFNNQWVCDENNTWHELTQAKFTADATARKEARMDYTGGIQNNCFFLENCGFFSENQQIGTFYFRNKKSTPPKIDFKSLPKH